MMKKVKYKIGLLFLIYSAVSLIALSGCGQKKDYSGLYSYSSGPCKSKTVSLKKVQGFGDKYYLVTIYGEDNPGGNEFLGTYDGARIEVENGSVILKGKSIEVVSGGKKCIYILSE